ncbi:glycosyltransferase [Photobacterium leiognathi subsp. mandapamensis]|uniref:glycosyltransferase n=1 Tax=Photobacterium leiognathi TaxID=553611 RepID=UPI003BF5C8A3
MTIKKIAVALSVYKSDNAFYLYQAIESIKNQTYFNFHIFIQVDGPVNLEVNDLLKKYSHDESFTIIFNDDNLGLAQRLNDIIELVIQNDDFSFIARMDADDICHRERFKKQVDYFDTYPDVDVLGSDVCEISSSGDEIFYKSMLPSHSEIKKNIIKKCPFNHPSVMFRTSIFKEGFRYKPYLMNTQDYYLWIDLIAGGKKFANINEPLLNFRVDDFFHHRRGFKKALNDINSRIYAFKKLKNVNLSNLIHVSALFLLRISPPFIKKLAYKNLR